MPEDRTTMASVKHPRHKYSPNMIHGFRGVVILSFLTYFVVSLSIRPSFVSLRRKFARIASSSVYFPPPLAENSTFIHNYFMNLAVEEAKEAGRKGEVPIGALIVERKDEEGSYRIVSRGYNMVETTHDATAHAASWVWTRSCAGRLMALCPRGILAPMRAASYGG